MNAKKLATAAVVALVSASAALSFDITGWEGGNAARGQWAWFTGQAKECKDPNPAPGKYTQAEWKEVFTAGQGKLPCGGAALKESQIKHIFKFVHDNASYSPSPMMQKPESCG